MKKMGVVLMAAVAMGATAAPVSAGVSYLWDWNPEACGGTSFETCISGGLNVVGNTIVVDITNIGPGTITGVGLWSLPGGTLPTGASASISGWNDGGSNDINGVVPNNSTRYAIGTTNGINDGLTVGNSASFTFTFGGLSNAQVLAFASDIGVGIHSQGVGTCSTKLYVKDGSVENPSAPGDISDCYSVPEPGSMALLATGMAGMAFIARRRRNGAEIIDEDGDDLEI